MARIGGHDGAPLRLPRSPPSKSWWGRGEDHPPRLFIFFSPLPAPRRSGCGWRPVVEDQSLLAVLGDQVDEALMRRVGQVGVAAGFVPEGHQKAVGEALCLALDADVAAPFEGDDLGDLAGQCGERGLNGGDLGGRRLGLEGEQDKVAKDAGGVGHDGDFLDADGARSNLARRLDRRRSFHPS